MGASSFSPSPMTITPAMSMLLSTRRMASTAAWSPFTLSPRPMWRAAARAAASVTLTRSRARFLVGFSAIAASPSAHPADQVVTQNAGPHPGIQPVQRSAVAGEQGAAVLDLHLTLEHADPQIPQGGDRAQSGPQHRPQLRRQ